MLNSIKRTLSQTSPSKSPEQSSKQIKVDIVIADTTQSEADILDTTKQTLEYPVIDNIEMDEGNMDPDKITRMLGKHGNKNNLALVSTIYTLLAEKIDEKLDEQKNVYETEIAKIKQNHDIEYNELKVKYQKLEDRIVQLELDKFGDRLIIKGIPESIGSDEGILRTWFEDFATKRLLFFGNEITPVFIQRQGNFPRANRDRPILIKFKSTNDRNMVWSRRFKLKDTKIFIDEVFPWEINQKRMRLFPIVREAKQKGYNAGVNVDKLMLNGKAYTVDDLDKLPTNLYPSAHSCKITKEYVAFFRKECELSNHHSSAFQHEDIMYCCNEQFYMRQMAIRYKDAEAERRIMSTDNPGRMIGISRNITGFDPEDWCTVAKDVMKTGARAKFQQNPSCLNFLKNTLNRLLIEANPNDSVWACGLHMHHVDIGDKSKWQGENWLGYTLMELRDELC